MAAQQCPIPSAIDWPLRGVASAQIGWRIRAHGQLRIAIVHAPLIGITPPMLAWWFGHIHGAMCIGAEQFSRYRVWHARDHIAHGTTRHTAAGEVGPGAQFHIVEAIGGRRIDTVVDIAQLDRTGVALQRMIAGRQIFRIAHEFHPIPQGTQFVTRIAIGLSGPTVLAPFNRAGRALLFPERFARALCRHSVEEVGNFVHFLPALYAAEGQGGR